jgi:O-antigen/teichoic acid export membrane protein
MSRSRRVIAGSVATWLRIAIAAFGQLLLVPVYLSHWGAETYGLWLAAFAIVSVTDVVFVGYQIYIGNEFLRLGFDDMAKMRRVFSTALVVACSLGCLQLILLGVLVKSGAAGWMFDLKSSGRDSEFGIVVLSQGIVSLICGSIGGVCVRLLSALGYFSRTAWWAVVATLATSFGPVIAVVGGVSFAGVGVVAALCGVGFNALMFVDMASVLRKHDFRFSRPDFSLALESLGRSLAITCKCGFELFRQQGSRLLLAPLAGASELTAFVTMRTGANIALQGIGTVMGPLLPELAAFVREKDQPRCEMVFASIWLVTLVALIPGVLVLQAVAAPLFALWTRGTVNFDPLVFALLSAGVLVVAVALPLAGILQVVNDLPGQLGVAAVSGVVTLLGIGLLVPLWSLRGAAFALLMAEIATALFSGYQCRQAMRRASLDWPTRLTRTVCFAVLAAIVMLVLIAERGSLNLVWLPIGIALSVGTSIYFLASMSGPAKAHLWNIASRVFGRALIWQRRG